MLGGAESDRAQVIRRGAIDLDTIFTPLFHQALGGPRLRVDRQALLHIALHARQDLREKTPGVIFRAYDTFQRVAADAVEQLILLPIAAWDACEPLAIR